MDNALSRTAMPASPVVDGSRFCQLNCFQDALIPVLRCFAGLADFPFDRLRLINPVHAERALRAGTAPGVFGGLTPQAMAEGFAITWRRPPAGAPVPDAVTKLLEAGPVLLNVDRFALSADERWHRRAHREHTLLIVDADSEGVRYLDGDHPVAPATTPWSDLLAPGRIAGVTGPVGVARARRPAPRRLAAWGRRFESDARELLAAPIGDLLRCCQDRVVAGARDRTVARTTGLDAVGYLNGVGHSVEAVGQAVRAHAPASVAGRVDGTVAAIDVACRRLMMVLNGATDRRVDAAASALDAVVGQWQGLRATVPSSLLRAASANGRLFTAVPS